MRSAAALALFSLLLTTSAALAGDWVGFRGLSAGGASDDKGLPTTWNPTENVVWKTELPGPGASSPIVTGDKVLVTCYRGVERGSTANLERILVCADRTSGKILWSESVKGTANEDLPDRQLMSHGYASSTPVTDGTNVYVLFGKSGVYAYDLTGKQLWRTDVGQQSAQNGWGSAASTTLYKNLVIVNAGAEGRALFALDKETGKELWNAPSDYLVGCWATPILVEIGEGKHDLVLNAPGEVWGFNPDTGKLRWWCDGIQGNTICPTVVVKDGVIYAIGGMRGMAVAVRAGGKEDVNQTHVVWQKNVGAYVTSPVIVGDHLYWHANGVVTCVKLADGETVYRERLSGMGGEGNSPRGFGGGFGGGGGQDYASVVAANNKIFAFRRQGECVVLAAEPTFKILARNKLDDDAGIFNATPAIHNGQLIVRSDKYLYCLGTK